MTTPTTPAAVTVATTLAAHPDGITTRALADASGVSPSTVAKTLTAMEADGTATRTPGPANGNRKTADIWHPATTTPADETPADAAPADETPADAAPADVATVAPVSGAPVGPRQPDLKVLIMAGVLGGHPEGVTADAAINESGLSVAMGDTILAAMEVSGAARRLPTEADGTELWVPVADADLAKVDPANAPTHTMCPTCGHTRKIRRPSARRAAATGTARTTGEINTDGSAKLAKNGLRNQVEAFMRDLGTGHDVTPGTVARELGGRSSGAVANAMARLTEPGVLVMTSEAPVKYALAETAPAPTADVVAFMTRPLTDDAPGTDEAADAAPATDEAADAAPADITDGGSDTSGDTAADTDAEDADAEDADAEDADAEDADAALIAA
jgi:hypothetical protein